MWERGMALLAWKLDSRGVVDDVVDHRGIGIGRYDYRRKEGGETINTQQWKQYKAIHSNYVKLEGANAGIHGADETEFNRQFYRLRVITGQMIRRGGCLVCGMLEGCGGGIGIIFITVDPFWATFVYKVFRSGQPLSVLKIIDRAAGGGRFDVRYVRGVWLTYG